MAEQVPDQLAEKAILVCLRKALEMVVAAREEARATERELLLLTGWEDQGTFNDVTWWYRDNQGGSEDQESAIRHTLRELRKVVDA